MASQNASRMALTTVRAKSVAMRSTAFDAWPKKVAGSSDAVRRSPRWYSSRNTWFGFCHSTLLSEAWTNWIATRRP